MLFSGSQGVTAPLDKRIARSFNPVRAVQACARRALQSELHDQVNSVRAWSYQ
jgi:hypothetical protein